MVKVWKEEVVIPTYETGRPDKNPMFLERRVYQGSSGTVYPYPVIESVAREKHDRVWHAVYLENEYIKVMVLPELGGRVQMAYDKLRQRHFIYHNHVIKPALVGLAGPWISGGIEFNWPQHHRPSTYMPVDCVVEESPDGSATVWVGERERMTHQKGMAGLTLRPGHAYLEVHGVVYNPTDMPQSFLWWANPAVAVNDAYQSIFPPDVHAVFDHGKRAVSSFPVATGTYYKMDYSAGVDISNYRNIKVPTSYMAAGSRFDFEGGYENDTRAGMLHVADHHIAVGKKQWTWGNGEFGRAWDRNLTDADGPYIELMAGVYTENQPDFSWLQPYEEKRFTQYFLPFRELGIVKNASKDLLLNIMPSGAGRVRLQVFATSRQEVNVRLTDTAGNCHYERTHTISPEVLLDVVIGTGHSAFGDLRLGLLSPEGKTLLAWAAEPDVERPLPAAAEAAARPAEVKTTEQLYLTGLHLEQYRHATYCALDYYEEALRRDPDDVRCNNAVGLWYLRRGRAEKAIPYLRVAVNALRRRNLNPYDGEPVYNLGLALKRTGQADEAYDCFRKAAWNGAWQAAGYLAAARISAARGDLVQALDETERSLWSGWHNHVARALRVALFRHAGRREAALELADESLAIDRLNSGCLYERYLITAAAADLGAFLEVMRGETHNFDELALDYCAAGLWRDADALWQLAAAEKATSPMTHYYQGWCRHEGGLPGAGKAFAHGRAACPDGCFPNRAEAIVALRTAMAQCPEDGNAPYLLGNLYYDKRQYAEAARNWERAARLNPGLPTVWRNLALFCHNKCHDGVKALGHMEHAFRLDTTDARIYMELDQLRKRLGHGPAERLADLCRHDGLVRQRDDLILEKATLLNQTGRFAEAAALIDAHSFQPWEGGEGRVAEQYQTARAERAKAAIAAGDTASAIVLLEECLVYPPHLGEGKLINAQDNDFHYLLGCAHSLAGRADEARQCWQRATAGPEEPAPMLYYNDARPDKIFYAGLAHRRLGAADRAAGIFHKLVNYGEQHLFDHVSMDYFAVSLPDLLVWDDDLDIRNAIHCHYLLALGHYGLGNADKADRHARRVRQLDPNHQGLQAIRSLIVHKLLP